MNNKPPKLIDEKLVTKRGPRRFVKDGYTRVMVKSWTISGSTDGVPWIMYQQLWSVAVQIESVSHHVLDKVFK